MTRIIAGIAGSMPLKGPASSTRPTSDRVKESLFGKLESLDAIDGYDVLDLYAGTGALGLEAASRGAKSVTLVESNKQAIEVCKANIQSIKKALNQQQPESPIDLSSAMVSKFLSSTNRTFDLVFSDPPYELSNDRVLEDIGMLESKLNRGAILVIERASKGASLETPLGFDSIQTKTYGDTAVYFFQKLD